MEWAVFFGSLVLLIQTCLQVGFSCRISTQQSQPSLLWQLLGTLLPAFAVTAIFLSHSSNFTPVIELLVLYGINRILLGNSRSTACTIVSIAVYINGFTLGAGYTLESFLLPWISALGSLRVFSIICLLAFLALLTVFLCWLCFRQIIKHFSFLFHYETPYLWLLSPICLLLLTIEIFLANKSAAERYLWETPYGNFSDLPYNPHYEDPLAFLALQCLGLGVLFMILRGYKRTANSLKAHAAFTEEIQAQKSYVTQANTRYERTRAFRHDVKNHLSVLEGFLKKHDMSGAQNYLEKLDASVLGLSFPVCTGVPVLDILLGNKLKLAEDSGISVEVSLIDPIIEIDDLDLCIIFSNALDNAITACKEAGKDSYIHITGKQQGDFYMLNFENTCVPDVQKHMGIGLSNIKESVEKYGGALSIETEHSCFLLSILWQKNR